MGNYLERVALAGSRTVSQAKPPVAAPPRLPDMDPASALGATVDAVAIRRAPLNPLSTVASEDPAGPAAVAEGGVAKETVAGRSAEPRQTVAGRAREEGPARAKPDLHKETLSRLGVQFPHPAVIRMPEGLRVVPPAPVLPAVGTERRQPGPAIPLRTSGLAEPPAPPLGAPAATGAARPQRPTPAQTAPAPGVAEPRPAVLPRSSDPDSSDSRPVPLSRIQIGRVEVEVHSEAPRASMPAPRARRPYAPKLTTLLDGRYLERFGLRPR